MAVISPADGGKPGHGLIPEKALIMSGYGINSEMETREALLRAGMDSDIVHINDLIAGRQRLSGLPVARLPRRVFLRGRHRRRQRVCEPGAK